MIWPRPLPSIAPPLKEQNKTRSSPPLTPSRSGDTVNPVRSHCRTRWKPEKMPKKNKQEKTSRKAPWIPFFFKSPIVRHYSCLLCVCVCVCVRFFPGLRFNLHVTTNQSTNKSEENGGVGGKILICRSFIRDPRAFAVFLRRFVSFFHQKKRRNDKDMGAYTPKSKKERHQLPTKIYLVVCWLLSSSPQPPNLAMESFFGRLE